jgi:hypothetical protein
MSGEPSPVEVHAVMSKQAIMHLLWDVSGAEFTVEGASEVAERVIRESRVTVQVTGL